jgi:hypothetical protein
LELDAAPPASRRPWSIDKVEACFVVKEANGAEARLNIIALKANSAKARVKNTKITLTTTSRQQIAQPRMPSVP